MNRKLFPIGILVLISCSIALAQFGGFDLGNVISGGDGVKKLVKGSAGISLKEELDMGGSLAVEIAAKKGGILKDEAMTKRVATIGKSLTLYCDRPSLDFTFAVLDNPDINAVSAPGGYVFVSKGLVEACKSDYQLAAVLAHEITHVTQRHALKMISGKESAQGALQVLNSTGATGGLGGFDGLISDVATSIIDKGLPKGDEYDADRAGTMLAYETGFPPRSLRDFLEKLKDQDSDNVFSTHPAIEDRVGRLDKILKSL